ncbi:MAG: hypothetical protein ACXVBQ_17550 [Pseudobdellovibrionaceae bacterium]
MKKKKYAFMIPSFILVLSASAMANPQIVENFGFDCKVKGSNLTVSVGAAGRGTDGYPSDMTTPRDITIKGQYSVNSQSQATCNYSATAINCNGEKIQLVVDLQTLRRVDSVIGALTGSNNEKEADAKATMKVKNMLRMEKEVQADLICELQG